jgi:secreted PhoX family phosphatase
VTLSRRSLLAAAGVAGLGGLGLWLRGTRGGARPLDAHAPPLRPGAPLDVPEGFRVDVVQRVGDRMSDGLPMPPRPDGMACFTDPEGRWVLMRNHEIPTGYAHQVYGGDAPGPAYDARGAGGVTRVVLDPNTLEVLESHLALSGTSMNCAGGATPWGWLSCEETEEAGHGFVFLTDPTHAGLAPPRRIDAYGRFKHEAVALVPDTHVAYLTEDRGDGCLFRFVPEDPAHPFEGRLQAMAGLDTGPLRAGERREVTWVDLEDISSDGLRMRAQRRGAARVVRGEGIVWTGDSVAFCATTGGPIGKGQIFRLRDEGEGGELEVLAASEDVDSLDMPDNLVVAPDGRLVVAEDGEGVDHLRVVDDDGQIRTLARNNLSDSELCGPCFSPDGRVLFVNMQEDGLTLALRGDFAQV